jgi:hypothetical protein
MQSALLAGLPQAPSVYDPFEYPARAIQRRNGVLNALYESGAITFADLDMTPDAGPEAVEVYGSPTRLTEVKEREATAALRDLALQAMIEKVDVDLRIAVFGIPGFFAVLAGQGYLRGISDLRTPLMAVARSGNVDAAVVTLPSAQVAKRGGARTLVTTTDLRIALQTVGLCGRNERIANSPELMTRLARGMVDGIVYILDPRNKKEVSAVLKKHLRLSADEDAETSYHSLRTIVSLDIAPDLAAFKNVQRIAARVNPKIAQVDVNEAINLSVVKTLEDSGYLAEARKKVALAR